VSFFSLAFTFGRRVSSCLRSADRHAPSVQSRVDVA
jgi:hypothetical protein